MPDVSRRELLGSLGGLGASALLAGQLLAACGSAAAPTTAGAPLATSFGYLPITDATPLLVAHAEGLMAEHGLDVARPARYRSWPELSLALQREVVAYSIPRTPSAVQRPFSRIEEISLLEVGRERTNLAHVPSCRYVRAPPMASARRWDR